MDTAVDEPAHEARVTSVQEDEPGVLPVPLAQLTQAADVVAVKAEGTGETSVDHPIVGDGVPPPCAGVAKELYCAKYAPSGGFAVTNFAFTVTIGFENAMLPAAYTVGEQNAM